MKSIFFFRPFLRKEFLRFTGAAAMVVFFAAAPASVVNSAPPSDPGSATVAGEVISPYPTITNLAIEWKIQGDENRNGVVEVEYRAAGESLWRRAMPLRRVPAGSSVRTRPIFHWDNKHSAAFSACGPIRSTRSG